MAGDVFQTCRKDLYVIHEEPDAYDVKVHDTYEKVLCQMQDNKQYRSLMMSMNYAGFVKKLEREGKVHNLLTDKRSKKPVMSGHWTDKEIRDFVEDVYAVLKCLLFVVMPVYCLLSFMTKNPVTVHQYLNAMFSFVNATIFPATLLLICYAGNEIRSFFMKFLLVVCCVCKKVDAETAKA